MNHKWTLMHTSKKNGYLLIEALVALFVCSIVSLLAVAFLQIALRMFLLKDDSQIQFAILQIRQELALCDSITIQEHQLTYVLNHEERSIYADKNRLVKSPGYEILMENVEEVWMYEEDDKIYIEVENKTYQLY